MRSKWVDRRHEDAAGARRRLGEEGGDGVGSLTPGSFAPAHPPVIAANSFPPILPRERRDSNSAGIGVQDAGDGKVEIGVGERKPGEARRQGGGRAMVPRAAAR